MDDPLEFRRTDRAEGKYRVGGSDTEGSAEESAKLGGEDTEESALEEDAATVMGARAARW